MLLVDVAAVAIEGPKGAGKTATALQRASTTHLLDHPGQLAVAQAAPERLTNGRPPILIDEWQRLPASWDLVRRAVDGGAAPGTFLLTGSASPRDAPTHSGAGRIVTLRMRPLSLVERGIEVPTVSLRNLLGGGSRGLQGSTAGGLETYVREMVHSGFPGIRGRSERASRLYLDSYLDRIVDHDLEEMGRRVRNPAALRRWMSAYAAATATTASYEAIRDAATGGHGEKPARVTVQPYIDILERLWILEPLPAWLPSRSPITRLGTSPKHHLADPALAVRLLGMDRDALLAGEDPVSSIVRAGPFLGSLFESLVTMCVRAFAQASEARVMHMRTRGPAEREIDLIVQRADQRVLAIEVKLSESVNDRDVRDLLWLRDRIGADMLDALVVTTGHEAYRRADGIGVVPAALLGP